jgi:hypothetical protein
MTCPGFGLRDVDLFQHPDTLAWVCLSCLPRPWLRVLAQRYPDWAAVRPYLK